MSKLYILLNTSLYTKLRVKLVSNNAKKGKITVKQLLQILFERVAKHIQVPDSSVPTHLFGIYASSKDGIQLLEDSDDPISYAENIFAETKLILKLRSSIDDILDYCLQNDIKLSPLFLKLLFLEIHTLFLSSADTLETSYNKPTLTQLYALILQSLLGDYRPYLYSGMSKSHFVPQRTAPVAEPDLIKDWSALQGKSSLDAMGDFLVRWNPDFTSIIQKEDPQQRLFLEISSKLEDSASLDTLKKLQQWIDIKMNKTSTNVTVNKISENPFVKEFSYEIFFDVQNEESSFNSLLNMLLDTIHSSDNLSFISNELKSGDFIAYFSSQLERSELSVETRQMLIKCLMAFASIEENNVYSVLGKNGALNWVILGLTQSMKEEAIVLQYLSILADICLNTKQFPKSEQSKLCPWALLINKGKLDSDLVEYLIDIAMSQFENSDETLFSVAISSILYMNLHFTSWRENAVVQTFLTKSESQNFGNYLIQILNRAEPHLLPATLKFLQDMFSHSESSDWFFLNDFRVLKEIIIRELQGLPHHDDKLVDYLELLYLVLKNHPNEEEKQHRIDEISAIVNAFLSLEVYPSTDPVYNVAEKIYINILS